MSGAKFILGYWLLGCLIVGCVIIDFKKECPNAKVSMAEVVQVVSVWPAAVIGGLFETKRGCPLGGI